ncbi:MAG: signal peptide peptidase SppA [Nitrospinota bacterium]|nr:signal peptide peptidase SppA [Nitrospinota bacterium]
MIKLFFQNRFSRYLFLFIFIAVCLSYFLSPDENQKSFYPSVPASYNSVGLVKIEGFINKSQEIVSRIDLFRKNPKVKVLVIFVQSRGGGVGPTQEIVSAIKRFKKSGKRIIASLGSVATSGGYYIASVTDKIYAYPGSIVGSIGVLMMLPNAEGLLNKVGVKMNIIKSSTHKDMTSPFRTITEKDRAILKDLVDDIYKQFVEEVSIGRKLSKSDVFKIADGRVFSGERAKKLGLVDILGTRNEAVLEAAKLSGIIGEPNVIELKINKGFFPSFSRIINTFSSWLGENLLLNNSNVLHYVWN